MNDDAGQARLGISSEADLSKLPTGELGWSRLIEYVLQTDDRAERYFLEVKSQIDLNSRKDRAKVAKFILGAANRDPDHARRRFGGHALMVLGVGGARIVGVPPFEAKDLALAVQRLIGSDGPRWDFERIRVNEHDVIVIVVDPPTGDVWTCRADGDGVTDGSIYVRADGETRRATGDEIRMLVRRATDKASPVEVDVSIDGEVVAIHVDESELMTKIESLVETLRGQVASGERGSRSMFVPLAIQDTRTVEEFLADVGSWEEAAMAAPTAGIVALAGRLNPGIRVCLRNGTRTFLRDVRVDISIGDAIATEWLPEERDEPMELFEGRPVDWGKQTIGNQIGLHGWRYQGAITPLGRHGIVHIRQEQPAILTMHMDSLRPEETHVSADDEVVLLMLSGEAPPVVNGQWRVTAQDLNDVLEGSFEIPVRSIDWREGVRMILNDDGSAPD